MRTVMQMRTTFSPFKMLKPSPIWRLGLLCHSSQPPLNLHRPPVTVRRGRGISLHAAQSDALLSLNQLRAEITKWWPISKPLNNPSESRRRCSNNRPVAWTFLFLIQTTSLIGKFDAWCLRWPFGFPALVCSHDPTEESHATRTGIWSSDFVVRWDRVLALPYWWACSFGRGLS